MHPECTILMQFLKKFPGEAPDPHLREGVTPPPPSPFRRFAPQWSLRLHWSLVPPGSGGSGSAPVSRGMNKVVDGGDSPPSTSLPPLPAPCLPPPFFVRRAPPARKIFFPYLPFSNFSPLSLPAPPLLLQLPNSPHFKHIYSVPIGMTNNCPLRGPWRGDENRSSVFSCVVKDNWN